MSRHAIIVIKNNNNEYLQYFDERWDSYLFLNCKLIDNIDDNIILKYISELLNIEAKSIKCKFINKKIHTKYSVSAKKEKEYEHYFYEIKFNLIPNKMKEKNFLLNSINYSWFSYEELISNERIKEVNSDIVSFVKEFNI